MVPTATLSGATQIIKSRGNVLSMFVCFNLVILVKWFYYAIRSEKGWDNKFIYIPNDV
jgi:hypothetical protein